MLTGIQNLWKNNKSFIIFIGLMFIFRSAIADWNDVPTGSMQPTILIGDRIFINKMAYDIRIPFTTKSIIKLADPQRGDIAIFQSKVTEKRLVKRVVGLPGDEISMANNILTVNGKTLEYKPTPSSITQNNDDIKLENLLGKEHFVTMGESGGRLASFSSVIVPAGQYLVLGDNRDNSADSRVIGFVPREEFIGKSSHVVLSLDHDNNYLPRKDRFFQAL